MTVDKQNKGSLCLLSIHSSPLAEPGVKDTGGMSTYIRELSVSLADSGYSIDVYTCRELPGNDKVISPYPGLRFIQICPQMEYLSKAKLYDHCEEMAGDIIRSSTENGQKYNLIFSHYWLSGVVGQLLKKKWFIPHLVMFHTLGAIKNKHCPGENEPGFRLKEEERLLNEAEGIIAPSLYEKENIISLNQNVKSRIRVFPCGVNRKYFRFMDRQKAKQKIAISAKKLILSVGRIEPVKGFDLLIETIPSLSKKADYRLVIVGDTAGSNALGHDLVSAAAARGIADRVLFRSAVSQKELSVYYNAADITVISSFYESFGLSALESISCGTPLAATPVGIVPELLSYNGNDSLGVIFRQFEPEHWSRCIHNFLTDSVTLTEKLVKEKLLSYDWRDISRSIDIELQKFIS